MKRLLPLPQSASPIVIWLAIIFTASSFAASNFATCSFATCSFATSSALRLTRESPPPLESQNPQNTTVAIELPIREPHPTEWLRSVRRDVG